MKSPTETVVLFGEARALANANALLYNIRYEVWGNGANFIVAPYTDRRLYYLDRLMYYKTDPQRALKSLAKESLRGVTV